MAERVLVLGASSLVGSRALPQLVAGGWDVIAASRRPGSESRPYHRQRGRSTTPGGDPDPPPTEGVRWVRLPGRIPSVDVVLSLAPVWAVPSCLSAIDGRAPRRVVALSSTSVVTKQASRDAGDLALSRRLAEGEAAVRAWCDDRGAAWVLLRPTMIYGGGHDRNVSDIARVVERFGVFPLVGGGRGLRQPVHRDDVAAACVAALTAAGAAGRCYALSGGERLAYGELVRRIFVALDRTPRTPHVSIPVARLLLRAARLLPRYRMHSMAVIDRMREDLVFDHDDASRDLGFAPRAFAPTRADLLR